VFVGGFAYVTEMGVLFMLQTWLHFSNVAAVAISFWIGFLMAFILQKYIAFQNHEVSRRAVARQLTAYSVLVVWNYLFTLGLVALLGQHMPAMFSRTFAIIVITAWNYEFYKKIFKPMTNTGDGGA
jgi:putative flippase GtrA